MTRTTRTRWSLACAALLTAALGILAAGLVRTEPPTDPTPSKEKPDVKSSTATARRAGIPPIDAAAPAKTETATFSLG